MTCLRSTSNLVLNEISYISFNSRKKEVIVLEESLGEYEMLDEVFEDLGDISGSVALDIGTGGDLWSATWSEERDLKECLP